MGGWKATPLTLYVVAWPDGVFKIGISSRQRWRGFVIRGAKVLFLKQDQAAHKLEEILHGIYREEVPRAFNSAKEAEPYLGVGGGGWLECYRVPKQCRSNAQAHAPAQTTNGRTDVLTNVLVTSEEISPLSDALTRGKDRP